MKRVPSEMLVQIAEDTNIVEALMARELLRHRSLEYQVREYGRCREEEDDVGQLVAWDRVAITLAGLQSD